MNDAVNLPSIETKLMEVRTKNEFLLAENKTINISRGELFAIATNLSDTLLECQNDMLGLVRKYRKQYLAFINFISQFEEDEKVRLAELEQTYGQINETNSPNADSNGLESD